MNVSRRKMMRLCVAGAGSVLAPWGVAQAQDRFDQDALLAFEDPGAVTLAHIGDLHGQIMPHYARAPEVNIGVGEGARQVPHLTGEAFRIRYGLGGGTPMHYAHTHEDFPALAEAYGKVGGLDRVARVLRAIRAAQPETLFLTGLENERGRLPGHPPTGPQVGDILHALGPEATGRDTMLIKRGGLVIALLRTPSNTAHLPWQIEDAKAQGAQVIVCLSQLGIAQDQALARELPDIDVILSSASAVALPEPMRIGATQIIASGTQGRFVSRVDLEVEGDGALVVRHKLIPMFSELIEPDPQIAAHIRAARAPFAADQDAVLGQAEVVLFKAGSLSSTWDDVICAALLARGNVDVALSPGVAWGNSILPGQNIRRGDLYSFVGGENPATYQWDMTGAALKELLEEEADKRFHTDPGKRDKHDMIRVGGLGFRLTIDAPRGARISELTMMNTQAALEATRSYRVAGWGAAGEGTAGPTIWQVLEAFIRDQPSIGAYPVTNVVVQGTK